MRSLAQQRKVFDSSKYKRNTPLRLDQASEVENHQNERVTTEAALRGATDVTQLNVADVGIADQEWKKYQWALVAAALLGVYLLVKGKVLRTAGGDPRSLPL